MKKLRLYHIRIQRYGFGMKTDIMIWPKVFPSYALADQFMTECFRFKGIDRQGRKLSASVELCR